MSDATKQPEDVDCGDASTADAIAYHLERDGHPGIEPEALAKWLRAMARRLRVRTAAPELLAACKAWVDYFDKLDRDSEPGDRLAEVRRQFHSNRVEATRAALARAGQAVPS